MSADISIPDAITAKAHRALAERARLGIIDVGVVETVLRAVWADVRLPDPTGPCVCSFDSEDRGGGHSELVQEYEPACPEHSEHVYDPVLGMWVLRDQVSRTRPERPEAAVEAVQPGEGGFF